jgi:predicted nucleotidyltransferase component of viral defense system
MPKEIRNVGASVRARLQKLSRETGQSFELILTRYALERLLYRLSMSAFVDRFVLKGAMLMTSWFADPHRATRDVDLLGFGDPSPAALVAAFKEILGTHVEDGVAFDLDVVRVDQIREGVEYGGLRLRTTASISGARIGVTIDVAFGDALEPGAEVIDYPCMLDLPAPRLRAYARETVIAEKFQAMVALGRTNSRMKDFYDIWLLRQSFPFDDDRLARAIAATFERRETAIPAELPDALTPDFAEDEQKRRQWKAFLENVALRPGSLSDVTASVAGFIMPHAIAAAKIGRSPLQRRTANWRVRV